MQTTANTLTIGRKEYGVEFLGNAEHPTVRLCAANGAVYDVTQGPTRTTCDCRDFLYRHSELDHSEGCKHVQAVVSAGMLRNASPYDVPAPIAPAEGQADAIVSLDLAEPAPSPRTRKPRKPSAAEVKPSGFLRSVVSRLRSWFSRKPSPPIQAKPSGPKRTRSRSDGVDWAVIAQRYVAGESMVNLASATGLSRQTVHRRLAELGTPIRSRGAK